MFCESAKVESFRPRKDSNSKRRKMAEESSDFVIKTLFFGSWIIDSKNELLLACLVVAVMSFTFRGAAQNDANGLNLEIFRF